MTRKNKINQNFSAYLPEEEKKPGYQIISNEHGVFIIKYTANGTQSLGRMSVRLEEEEGGIIEEGIDYERY